MRALFVVDYCQTRFDVGKGVVEFRCYGKATDATGRTRKQGAQRGRAEGSIPAGSQWFSFGGAQSNLSAAGCPCTARVASQLSPRLFNRG